MIEKKLLRKLLHDLSSPVSLLLLLEDQLPEDARQAVLKLREIIEEYRNMLNNP